MQCPEDETSPSRVLQTLAFEEVIPLFQKSFEARTTQENNTIVSFLDSVPHFHSHAQACENPKTFLLQLSKLFKFQSLAKGQAISHNGDTPSQFWFILKGNVRKYIRKQPSEIAEMESIIRSRLLDEQNDSSVSPDSRNEIPQANNVRRRGSSFSPNFRSRGLSILKPVMAESNPQRSSERETRTRSKVFTFSIIPVPEVECFKKFNMHEKYFVGEDTLAVKLDKVLLSGDSILSVTRTLGAPLACTLVAWEEVCLIYIPIEEYLVEIEQKNKNLNEKLTFLQQMFPDLSERSLTKISSTLQTKKMRTGEILFNENSECSELHILRKGEVELTKNISVLKRNVEEAGFKSKISARIDKTSIIIVSGAQFLGEEIVLNKDTRTFTAQVKTAETIFYSFSKEALVELEKFNSKILRVFKMKAQENFGLKLERLEANFSKAGLISNLLNSPTTEEKEAKNFLQKSLKYYSRELFLENLLKREKTTNHFNSKDNEISLKSPKDFQKMANVRSKVLRTLAKVDPRYEMEEASTIADTTTKILPKVRSGDLNKGPAMDILGLGETTSSLWNVNTRGTFIERKLLKQQNPKQATTFRESTGFVSPSRVRETIGFDPVTQFSNELDTTRSKRMQTNNGSISLAKTSFMNHITSDWDESKFLAKSPITILASPTTVGSLCSSPTHPRVDILEKVITRELNEMMAMKLNENLKARGYKGKVNRVKKGLESPKRQQTKLRETERQVNLCLDMSSKADKSLMDSKNQTMRENSPKKLIISRIQSKEDDNSGIKYEKDSIRSIKIRKKLNIEPRQTEEFQLLSNRSELCQLINSCRRNGSEDPRNENVENKTYRLRSVSPLTKTLKTISQLDNPTIPEVTKSSLTKLPKILLGEQVRAELKKSASQKKLGRFRREKDL